MTIQLTKGERQVLTELLEIQGTVSISDLAEQLSQKETRILSILQALAERDLVVIQTEETVT